VSEKFIKQLKPERSQPAATYFLEKLRVAVELLHKNLPLVIQQSKEKAGKADLLLSWLMNRINLMEHFSQNAFSPASYLALMKNKVQLGDASYLKALNAIPNEKLYEQMLTWRQQIALKDGIMPNMVLTEKTMATIAERLPATLKALSGIKGIGTQKTAQYGNEIITMIRQYQQKAQGQSTEQVSLF
jgi:superfamily II DNA helicase RecQ